MCDDAQKSSAQIEYELRVGLDEVRQRLLAADCQPWLERPLGHWVTSEDRMLPAPFLTQSVGDILNTPFDDLFATPAIGKKKFQTLLALLRRVADSEEPSPVPLGDDGGTATMPGVARAPDDPGAIDAAEVTELSWSKWQARIVEHGLERETIGRLARSLRDVPRVLWAVPLQAYTSLSLSEVRALKTYGRQRVRVLVELFAGLDALLEHLPATEHLATRIVPKFVDQISHWAHAVCARRGFSDLPGVVDGLFAPLIAQVRWDVGDTAADLISQRLGTGSSPASINTVSRQMGLHRSRAQYLLDAARFAMQVRWPEGVSLLAQVQEAIASDASQADLLKDVLSLLFQPVASDEDSAESSSLPSGSQTAYRGRFARLGRESSAVDLQRTKSPPWPQIGLDPASAPIPQPSHR